MIIPQVERKKKEWMNVEKGHKSACVCLMFYFFSKPERTSWSLIPHLDTVITEVSSVKGLRLRGNPLRLYRAKHLLVWIEPTVTQDFNMKVLTFAKDGLFFKPLLTCIMTNCVLSLVTNISHVLKLLSLVQRLRYVHHSQATPISYILVADYWSSTATLSYKPL